MSEKPDQQVLAIIPARGGSKGVPQKNIRLLAGKPLIAWTIEAARQAACVNRVVVSTDDQTIAEIAKGYGAEVPFLRPRELAQDQTPGIAPLLHAVRWMEEHQKYRPAYVMLLQPTSPFRGSADIDAAYRMATERQADAVVSIMEAHQHPYWMKRLTPDNLIEDFIIPPVKVSRRQDLPPAHALNGALYLIKRDVLLAQETLYPNRTYGYVMPLQRSLDIDSPWDFFLAETLMQHRSEA